MYVMLQVVFLKMYDTMCFIELIKEFTVQYVFVQLSELKKISVGRK